MGDKIGKIGKTGKSGKGGKRSKATNDVDKYLKDAAGLDSAMSSGSFA